MVLRVPRRETPPSPLILQLRDEPRSFQNAKFYRVTRNAISLLTRSPWRHGDGSERRRRGHGGVVTYRRSSGKAEKRWRSGCGAATAGPPGACWWAGGSAGERGSERRAQRRHRPSPKSRARPHKPTRSWARARCKWRQRKRRESTRRIEAIKGPSELQKLLPAPCEGITNFPNVRAAVRDVCHPIASKRG